MRTFLESRDTNDEMRGEKRKDGGWRRMEEDGGGWRRMEEDGGG